MRKICCAVLLVAIASTSFAAQGKIKWIKHIDDTKGSLEVVKGPKAVLSDVFVTETYARKK